MGATIRTQVSHGTNLIIVESPEQYTPQAVQDIPMKRVGIVSGVPDYNLDADDLQSQSDNCVFSTPDVHGVTQWTHGQALIARALGHDKGAGGGNGQSWGISVPAESTVAFDNPADRWSYGAGILRIYGNQTQYGSSTSLKFYINGAYAGPIGGYDGAPTNPAYALPYALYGGETLTIENTSTTNRVCGWLFLPYSYDYVAAP